MHLPVVGLLKCLTKRHNSKGGWVDAEDTFHLLEVEHASMWGLFMVMSHSDMSCKMSHCNVSCKKNPRTLFEVPWFKESLLFRHYIWSYRFTTHCRKTA